MENFHFILRKVYFQSDVNPSSEILLYTLQEAIDDFTTSRYSAGQTGLMQVFLDVSELALNLVKSQCKTLM
jgi:hypothetical protein